MIIYAIEVKGSITNYDWSIVTIWKNIADASEEIEKYRTNVSDNDVDDWEYRIKELDTDNECIYDYQEE